MSLGVYSGVTTDDEFAFSDDETVEMSLEEEDLQGTWTRVTLVTDLWKEVAVVFTEYRNYNRIQLTTKRVWDQYLQKTPGTQSPDPLPSTEPPPTPTAAPTVVAVATGQPGLPVVSVVFAPRSTTTVPGPVSPAIATKTCHGVMDRGRIARTYDSREGDMSWCIMTYY